MKLNIRHIVALVLVLAIGATATFAAGTVVDLTPSKAIKYIGQPGHGTWCNYLPVAEADRKNTDGKFNILPSTKLSGNATVSTNYGETVTTTVTSNVVSFSTKYGLGGAIYVCFTGIDKAPKYGGIGIGNAPTTKAATVDYLGMTEEFWTVKSDFVRVANIRLNEVDATEFTITAKYDKTKVTAWIGNIELGVCKATTANFACKFSAPENTVFSELGYGLYVQLKVEYNGDSLPNPAVDIGLDLP